MKTTREQTAAAAAQVADWEAWWDAQERNAQADVAADARLKAQINAPGAQELALARKGQNFGRFAS